MARRTKSRWSYLSGEKGRNRVRVFEHSSGMLMMEFQDEGRRKRESLGHRDRARAKREADEVAADLATAEELKPEAPREVTLDELFEMYLGERTPTKSAHTQQHDRRAAEMFKLFFGAETPVSSLDIRDGERFIQARRQGRVKPAKRKREGGVGERIIEQDLKFILAVFNWATMVRGEDGRELLERNPFRGLSVPREKNPVRPTLTDGEYKKLLGVADEVDWRFRGMLILAHETGHRIGAIRQLRWSDIDVGKKLIRWPGSTEKTGYGHVTPITDEAVVALRAIQAVNPGIGEAPLFPAAQNASEPVDRWLPRKWWKQAEALAELKPEPRRGWHSLRRKFASDLMHRPLKVLCELGGWKDPQTILKCYQHPDEDQLREALADRRAFRKEA